MVQIFHLYNAGKMREVIVGKVVTVTVVFDPVNRLGMAVREAW
jgi:hypothetical protein